jgi:hypothetical protein
MPKQPKTRPNELCSCGSGLKYKKCCARHAGTHLDPETVIFLNRLKAKEAQRVKQQGHGRPIITSVDALGSRIVQVGNDLIQTKTHNFFDFILTYMKNLLGNDWIKSESMRPTDDRHVVVQWYDLFTRIRSRSQVYGQSHVMQNFGVINALAALSYGFYLLRHNVELQDRLLKRIRDRLQFQGAYYEVIVASIMIRAGFELQLEDESDDTQKHCEFSAKSTDTGVIYTVECKSRSVPGVLHKAAVNASKRHSPTSQIVSHLKDALRKPASGERIVFIDINAPAVRVEQPEWVEETARVLARYQRDLLEKKRAFVFVTNICFHWHLEEIDPPAAAFAHGFNIPDFAQMGEIRFSDAWRAKQKYKDIHKIGDFFSQLGKVPSTFDGSLPSATLFGELPPVQIGEKYVFTDADDIVGTVTSATVGESEGTLYVAVSSDDGRNVILRQEMSDRQLSDYREHKDTYFGEVSRNGDVKTDFEMYEWLVKTHMEYDRDHILKQLSDSPYIATYKVADKEELVLMYCERLMAFIRLQSSQSKSQPSDS